MGYRAVIHARSRADAEYLSARGQLVPALGRGRAWLQARPLTAVAGAVAAGVALSRVHTGARLLRAASRLAGSFGPLLRWLSRL